jgi:hypothetical protein
LIPIAIYLLMVIYFSQVPNPFISGEKGQTWNLFKISNWAYPWTMIIVGYGLHQVKNLKSFFVAILCVCTFFWGIQSHIHNARESAKPAMEYTYSTDPFTAYKQFAELVRKINLSYQNQPIELEDISNIKHRQMLAYFLYPQEVYSDFKDDVYIASYLDKNNHASDLLKNNLHIASYQALSKAIVPLPAGVFVADTGYGLSFADDWYGQENDSGNSWNWSNGSSTVFINNYALHDNNLLECQMQTLKVPAILYFYLNQHWVKTVKVTQEGLNLVKVPLKLLSGKNTLKISTNIAAEKLPQDSRLLAFRLQNLTIQQ